MRLTLTHDYCATCLYTAVAVVTEILELPRKKMRQILILFLHTLLTPPRTRMTEPLPVTLAKLSTCRPSWYYGG